MKILNQKILGQNIAKIRIEKGLIQEEVIAKLQVKGSPISRSTYSKIELGEGNIFDSDLVGLQQIFNIDFSDFFEGIVPSRPSRNEKDE